MVIIDLKANLSSSGTGLPAGTELGKIEPPHTYLRFSNVASDRVKSTIWEKQIL